MHNELERLYENTVEDLLFGIGTIQLPNAKSVPIIQICYKDWSHQNLEVVRESFRDGLILTRGKRRTGAREVYLATRLRMALQAEADGHTAVLKAPAWDAHLADVEEPAFRIFEAGRQRFGGYLLVVQTAEREFLTVYDDARDRTTVGVVLPSSLPCPSGPCTH